MSLWVGYAFVLGFNVSAWSNDDHGTVSIAIDPTQVDNKGVQSPQVGNQQIVNNVQQNIVPKLDQMANDPNTPPEERQQILNFRESIVQSVGDPAVTNNLAPNKNILVSGGREKVATFNAVSNIVEVRDRETNSRTFQKTGANIDQSEVEALKSVQAPSSDNAENTPAPSSGSNWFNNMITRESSSSSGGVAFTPAERTDLVAVMLTKARTPASARTPAAVTNAGTVQTNSNNRFNETLGEVRGAGSSGSGSGRSELDLSDVGSFVDRARDTLGVPREGFDLSSNPFYSPAAGAEIRSVFKDFAMGSGLDGDPDYLAEQSKLNKLVTTPGFQDLSMNTLGPDGAKDLNLSAAGAAIAADPGVSELGLALSKDYIYKNLSTNDLIAANPVLASLDQGLGVGSLAQLSPKTLEWLALSGNLAFGEIEKIPEPLRAKREDYKAAFLEMKAWLESLRSVNALSELDNLKVPMDPALVSKEWKANFTKLHSTHTASVTSIESSKKLEKQQKKTASMIRTVSNWLGETSQNDIDKLMAWKNNVYKPTKFSRAWSSADPIAVENAKYYFSRTYYYSTVSKFSPDSKSKAKTLVADAQRWGDEIRRAQERQRSLNKAKALAHQSTPNK